MSRFLAAAVQMTSGAEKERNIQTATRLVERAVGLGAELVVLPELFDCLTDPDRIAAGAEAIPGPTTRAMSELAAMLRITLLAGTIAERADRPGKIHNTSVLFSPTGEQLASYRKIHLFDIDLPGRVTFQESRFVEAGEQIAVTQTDVCKLGQATCYDLRFPELFRRLVDKGAEVLAIPSAFAQPTGRDHWEVLLRARAIENQVFVIAPNQFGQHTGSIATYGRSMIVDPWGTVLATAPDGEAVITAEIDLDRQAEIRNRLPALSHRRDLGKM